MRRTFSNYRCTKHLLTLLLFVIAHCATQAAIIPASSPEITLVSGVKPDLLNIDMVRCPLLGGGANYLSAFAYEDRNTFSVRASVVFPGSPQLNFSISNAVQPDIIIADDYINPGRDYLLCIVYNDNYTTGRLAVYRISGIGTGTMTQSLVYNIALPNVPTAIKYPHIDGLTDPNQQIGGLPSIHEFVVVWTGGMNAEAEYRDVDPTLGTSGLLNSITLSGSQTTDVAAATDITTGDKSAFFFHLGIISVAVEEWDVTGTTTTSTSLTLPASTSNTDIYSPHIEAMSLYDPGAGWVKWQAVAGHLSSVTSLWNVYGYSDLSTTAVALSTGITGSNSAFGAVAAGIGQTGSSTYIGNTQYTTIWYDMANATNYARYIDASANTLSADEYEVNCSGCTPVGRAGQPVAVTNSSNDGYDILTAWYDGSNIVYKKTGNSASYKPLSIQEETRDELKLYPNPSADILHVANAGNCKYTIIDISGHIVMNGELVNGNVDVTQLQNGFYTITINSINNTATSLAFSKE